MDGTIECQGELLGETAARRHARPIRRRRAAETASVVEGMSHALRNPLFAVRLELHTLEKLHGGEGRRGLKAADAAGIFRKCEGLLDRVDEILSETVSYALPAPTAEQRLDLEEALNSAISRFVAQRGVEAARVRLQPIGRPLFIFMDPLRLQNALAAALELVMSSASSSAVSINLRSSQERAEVHITNPQGVLSKRDRQKIFKPFASFEGIKPSMRLAAARRDIEQAGGRVACLSGSRRGTSLRIQWPLCP
jgi:C4-dicarboxylate-specific signal transduction histidine kinase